MKNIKRFTALVLVIALAASFMITAGADSELSFSDAKNITAVEAVEVLSDSKVNIIQGFDTGDFQPAGNVTREQAIKMISVALLGGDYGSSLTGMEQLFTDVLGTRWSAGYIAYGVSQNIIVGYGDGKFGPADNVTYGQLAKMLLTALGYGKNGEYEGSGWLLSSIGDAKSLGIFKGLDISDYSAPASRNDAAQMIFNGITEGKCVIVNYSKDTEAYVKTTQTIGAKSFDLSKNTAATDKLGRPAHQWKSGKTNVSSVYNDGAKLTYTAKVNGTALAKAIKDESLTYETKDVTSGGTTTEVMTFNLYVNGESETLTSANFKYALDQSSAFAGIAARATTVPDTGAASYVDTYAQQNYFTSGNGVLIEIYADGDDVITDIVVVETYLGTVRSVTAAKGDTDRYVTVRFDDKTGTAKNITYTTDDFAKDDLVYVTPVLDALGHNDSADTTHDNNRADTFPVTYSYDGAATVAKAGSSLRGIATKASGSTFTIGGETYTKALIFDHFTIDFDTTYDFYLDEYGYIIGTDVFETTDSSKIDNYLYIQEAKEVSSGVTGGVNARAYFMDGSSKVIDLRVRTIDIATVSTKVIGNTEVPISDAKNDWDDATDPGLVGGFYTYSVNSSGEYTLTKLGTKAVQTGTGDDAYVERNSVYVTEDSSSLLVANAAAGFSGKKLSDATTLSVIDGKLTTYSGVAKFPTKSSGGVEGVGANSGGNFLGALAIYNDSNVITQLAFVYESTHTGAKTYGMWNGDYYAKDGDNYFGFITSDDGVKDIKITGLTFSSASKSVIYEIDGESVAPVSATREVTITDASSNYFEYTYSTSSTGAGTYNNESVVVNKDGKIDTLEEGDEAYIYVDTDGVLVAAFIK